MLLCRSIGGVGELIGEAWRRLCFPPLVDVGPSGRTKVWDDIGLDEELASDGDGG